MSKTKNLAIASAVLSAGGMAYMVGNSPDKGDLFSSTAKRAWDALSENPTATGVVALLAFSLLCAYFALRSEKKTPAAELGQVPQNQNQADNNQVPAPAPAPGV